MYNMVSSPWCHSGLQAGFKNFTLFIRDLHQAINGERRAVDYYTCLMELAPNDEAREQVRFARDDEMKHFRMFSQFYKKGLFSAENSPFYIYFL